jgi:hypothetical protein
MENSGEQPFAIALNLYGVYDVRGRRIAVLRKARLPRVHPASRAARSRSLDVTSLTAPPMTLANGDSAGFATGVTAYTRPS